MPHIKINLLGAVQVWVDGFPVDKFRSTKTVALLATLIIEARPMPRTTLAARFWPEQPKAVAHTELRRCLSNLRKRLPDCFKANRDSAVFIPPHHFILDLHQIGIDTSNQSPNELRQLCLLCKGPLLEGLDLADAPDFEYWLTLQRNQWQQTAVSLHQALIAAAERERDWLTAVWAANRLLHHAPAHEPTHRQLMRFYLRLNQRNQALEQFDQCQKALRQAFDVAPAASTRWLYEQIRAVDSWTAHNLPHQTSSFVGRKAEIGQLVHWLTQPDVGLVSLIGPGGMGKTRLAQQVARELRGAFLHGLFWVDLEPLNDPALLANQIAKAVGIQLHGSDKPYERVLDHLAVREMLLLLDNFEHLQPHLLTQIQELRQRAPQVKLLITSRQRLPLAVASQLTVGGLDYAPSVATKPTVHPAIELFFKRARQQQPRLSLAAHQAAVQTICETVGGMPLALEMAAAWCGTHTPRQIATLLQQTDALLQQPHADPKNRHFSIRAIFDHSWAQLTFEEQATLIQLAIFQGGFTHEAAQVVAQATTAQLVTLINQSLLQRDENGRYHFHPLILQFIRERLGVSPFANQTTNRFILFFISLIKTHNIIRGSNQLVAIQQMTIELANIRKLWSLLIEQQNFSGVAQCVDSIWAYGELTGQMQEVDELFQTAILAWQPLNVRNDLADWHNALAALNLRHAWFGFRLSKFQQSRQTLNQSLYYAMMPALDNLADIRPHIYYTKALLEWYDGEFKMAQTHIEQCLVLGRANEDMFAQNIGYQLQGFILEYQGQVSQALRVYLQSDDLALMMGDRRGQAVNHTAISRMYLNTGQIKEAEKHLRKAKTIAPLNDSFVISFLKSMQGLLATNQGNHKRAQQKFSESINLAEKMNDSWMVAFCLKQQVELFLQIDKHAQASEAMCKIINLTLKMETRALLLEAMTTAVVILHLNGLLTEAAQVATFIFHHPATPAYARRRVQPFVTEAFTNKPLPDLWQTAVSLRQTLTQISKQATLLKLIH